MAEICVDCSNDGVSTPCNGGIVKIYDISVQKEFEVVPTVKLSRDESSYYYEFLYTSSEGTYTYLIYSANGGVDWAFIKEDTQVKSSIANVPAGGNCPPASGWTSTNLGKAFVTGIEYRVIPTNSSEPVGICYPSINVPDIVNRLNYTEVLANFKNCFNTKVTTYYNKISGGVPCDNMELTKMQLILNLLDKKDCDSRALNCIYNRTPAPGVAFDPIDTLTPVTTVFGEPTKITAIGNFLRYLGYQILVTRATGEQITHTILDASYNTGSNVITFTINPAVSGVAYSATPAQFVTPSYTTTTYLETFLNFANKYCADCIVTPNSVAISGSGITGKAPSIIEFNPSIDYLGKEGSLTSNNIIYLESEFPINLI